MAELEIQPGIAIPEGELRFETSRSGGPGGQNVNKVESRVALLFDLAGSPSLDDEQKRRVATRLKNRINKDGELRVVCQTHRTQEANRRAAVARFLEILAEALKQPKKRRAVRRSAASKRRRLEAKKQRGQIKELRGKVRGWEG
jgi:ribosome-associated protein